MLVDINSIDPYGIKKFGDGYFVLPLSLLYAKRKKFDDNYQFFQPDERLSFDEIEKIVAVFANYGVNKIRITGGEPLLRKNLDQLISKIKNQIH